MLELRNMISSLFVLLFLFLDKYFVIYLDFNRYHFCFVTVERSGSPPLLNWRHHRRHNEFKSNVNPVPTRIETWPDGFHPIRVECNTSEASPVYLFLLLHFVCHSSDFLINGIKRRISAKRRQNPTTFRANRWQTFLRSSSNNR